MSKTRDLMLLAAAILPVWLLAGDGLTADASGTVTHVAICTASALLYVTTCTSQAVTSGNTVNVGALDVEIADPT